MEQQQALLNSARMHCRAAAAEHAYSTHAADAAGSMADAEVPSQAAVPLIPAAMVIIASSEWVNNRAVAAGMMMRAATRSAPTD